MLDRKTAPPAGRISRVDIIKAKSTDISGGLPIHVVKAGDHDIIRLEIVLKSGKWHEPANGLSYFTSNMLLEGTSTRNARQLAELFEFNGAQVQVNAGLDFNILVVYVIKSRFQAILGLVKDCLVNPEFPEKELDTLKDIQRDQLRISLEKNSYVASRAIRRALYGPGHPYGRSLEEKDIDENISRNALVGYYRDHLLKGPEFILSGNVSKEMTGELAIFADIPAELPVERNYEIALSETPEIHIARKDSLQASIRWGRHALPKSHPDYIGIIVLNEIFGGFFGSRLMKNIREDKGYTYGIHSSVINHVHGNIWVTGTDVKKDFVEDTLRQIHFEARRLQEDLISDEELLLVKNYMLGNFLSSLETSFSLADKFKSIYFFGQDYGYYDRYIDGVNTITARDIRALAVEYLDPAAFRTVVVG